MSGGKRICIHSAYQVYWLFIVLLQHLSHSSIHKLVTDVTIWGATGDPPISGWPLYLLSHGGKTLHSVTETDILSFFWFWGEWNVHPPLSLILSIKEQCVRNNSSSDAMTLVSLSHKPKHVLTLETYNGTQQPRNSKTHKGAHISEDVARKQTK